MVGVWLLKTFLFADDPRARRQIHMVTLVKPPPPPPPPEEEPPPPEPEEEIVEPEPEQAPETPDESADDTPASENLGVDAEGTAGGDSFGLVGNKGGRSLIGGGLGESSLLRKYAWYTRLIQDEIRREIKRRLETNGGWPDTGQNAKVKIVLDSTGQVVDFSLVAPSGSELLDQTVLAVLPRVQVREPPPPDMPLSLFIRVAPRG
ncbi:MAG: hypothetical protein A2X84_12790 [Desulfuromonadaceae bacterium GWC2_58_13]|nr:MAG: hypothetical protein A2X84_12790 [Desulfuromonadaceae bacterium GWC2_58_13]